MNKKRRRSKSKRSLQNMLQVACRIWRGLQPYIKTLLEFASVLVALWRWFRLKDPLG